MAGLEERRHSTGGESNKSGIFNRFFGFVWGGSSRPASRTGDGSSSSAPEAGPTNGTSGVGKKQKRRDNEDVNDGRDAPKQAAKRRRMTLGSGGRNEAGDASVDDVAFKGVRVVDMTRDELVLHLRALGLGCGGARSALVRRLANAARTLQRLRADSASTEAEARSRHPK